jgi:hypothetical protein
MANLYRTDTIDRMWALLEAYAPFTDIIKQSRRVKDTAEGWLKRLFLRSVGDYPHVQIEMGDNFGGGPITIETFNAEPDAFGTGASNYWLEERTSDFKISIIYEVPGFDKQDALEMAILQAFERAGRNLGVDAILKWGPWKGKRNGSASIPGQDTPRPVTQITIPVVYQFTGAELKQS